MTRAEKEIIAEVANELDDHRPELSAQLRALIKSRRGRPKGATGNGERNEWLADIWCEIEDADGTTDALAAAQKRSGLSESIILDVWYRRRPRVNEILRQRGRLK
jgi:hypothetical protein